MSDEQIRRILIQRKKEERKLQRRADIIEAVEGFLGFGAIFFIGFMLSVIAG